MNNRIALFLVACISITLVGPALAQFQRIDAPDIPTRQICTDGESVYALKQDGRIFQFQAGQWSLIDPDMGGTRQIAADAGRVYAVKNDGRLFRRNYGQWQCLAYKGSKQIAVAGYDIFSLENNEDVFVFSSRNGQWYKVDNGTNTLMIAADTERGLYVLKANGNIYHHLGGMRFELFDPGTYTKQIVATEGKLYVLKNSGQMFRWDGGWNQIDPNQGTQSMAAAGYYAYALRPEGIWMFAQNQGRPGWGAIDQNPGTREIVAKAQVFAVLKDNSELFLAYADQLANNRQVTNFNNLYGNR